MECLPHFPEPSGIWAATAANETDRWPGCWHPLDGSLVHVYMRSGGAVRTRASCSGACGVRICTSFQFHNPPVNHHHKTHLNSHRTGNRLRATRAQERSCRSMREWRFLLPHCRPRYHLSSSPPPNISCAPGDRSPHNATASPAAWQPHYCLGFRGRNFVACFCYRRLYYRYGRTCTWYS